MFRLAAAAAVAALVALVLGGRALLAEEGRVDIGSAATESLGHLTREIDNATARAGEAAKVPAWVERGNALCRAEQVELDALARPSSVEELAVYLRRAIRIAAHYEALFARLRLPAGYRDELARLNRMSLAGRKLLRRMLAAAERNDTAGVLDAAEDGIALARLANPIVRKLGLDECALSPTGLAA
jgi:hypothetical protein